MRRHPERHAASWEQSGAAPGGTGLNKQESETAMLDSGGIANEDTGGLGITTRRDAVPPRPAKRGRRRAMELINAADPGVHATADILTETALGTATSKLVDKLRKQGLIKTEFGSCEGGGAGHRTRNCRPVQVNMSEKMFRQLKVIAATQGLSIKEQIIQALLQQGYTE
jgi:hypothetical protein